MTQEQMAEVMERIFEECRQLRAAGQREYAHEEDNAFRNFEGIARALDLSRERVLWVYAAKHIDGIVAYINGHTSQRESVKGRLNDLVVYVCLLRGMVEEDETGPF